MTRHPAFDHLPDICAETNGEQVCLLSPGHSGPHGWEDFFDRSVLRGQVAEAIHKGMLEGEGSLWTDMAHDSADFVLPLIEELVKDAYHAGYGAAVLALGGDA
jgi:hypothetical protein